MALATVFTFKSSVLYTFYPPLQAHPLFYIGLTLLVVGSWGWVASMIASWRQARAAHPDRPVSLALHATVANAMLWALATIGVAAEMLFQLIPWSLGLEQDNRSAPGTHSVLVLRPSAGVFLDSPGLHHLVHRAAPRSRWQAVLRTARTNGVLAVPHPFHPGRSSPPVSGSGDSRGLEAAAHLQHDDHLVPQLRDGLYHRGLAGGRGTATRWQGTLRLDSHPALGQSDGGERAPGLSAVHGGRFRRSGQRRLYAQLGGPQHRLGRGPLPSHRGQRRGSHVHGSLLLDGAQGERPRAWSWACLPRCSPISGSSAWRCSPSRGTSRV